MLKTQATIEKFSQPEAIIIFNTQYNLENLKKSKPTVYVELLQNLIGQLKLTDEKAIQFTVCSDDDMPTAVSKNELYSATQISDALQSDRSIQIQAVFQEYKQCISITEPSTITQCQFDTFALLLPNCDKTALFEPTIESVINLEKTPLPELDQLLHQITDKTILNADSMYLCPIYINEHNQLVVLGEVALSVDADAGLRVQGFWGKYILENANAKALTLNHCFKPFCDEVNPSNIAKKGNFLYYDFYTKEQAKEVVSNLTTIEKEAFKKHIPNAEHINEQLEKHILLSGKQRVFNEMSSILLYQPHDRIMNWLVTALMRKMSNYLHINPYKQMNAELLPLITFVDNLN
jgi:hypothetical protein